MLQLLSSLGYKSVEGSPGTRDERDSPSHNLILLFRIFPKLLFDTMRPMFQQSMDEIEMLCKKYVTCNSKSKTKRIDAINPVMVSKWLNSSAKTPKADAKWRKEFKKTHSLTSTDNTALDKERKACNFGAKYELKSAGLRLANDTKPTEPLTLRDMFRGVLHLEKEVSIKYWYEKPDENIIIPDQDVFPKRQEWKTFFSMNATYKNFVPNKKENEENDDDLLLTEPQEFHGNYPSTMAQIANNIGLFLSHSFAIAAKDSKVITQKQYAKIMVGFYKLQSLLDFVQNLKRNIERSLMEGIRTLIGIRLIDALHFLAPLCRQEANRPTPICGEGVLGLMLYSIIGPKGLRWYPQCTTSDDPAEYNDSLFDNEIISKHIELCIEGMKDTKAYKSIEALQYLVEQFENEYNGNKAIIYSDMENMEFMEVSQASMVDILPRNFDLKNPLREAKKYMENEKISTAITDDSTGEIKEPPTRKSPRRRNSPRNASNKRPRMDLNGDPQESSSEDSRSSISEDSEDKSDHVNNEHDDDDVKDDEADIQNDNNDDDDDDVKDDEADIQNDGKKKDDKVEEEEEEE